MADTVKTTKTLVMVAEFADGDDRTITADNPKASIAGSEINSLGSFIKNNAILIGDKAGAAFNRFKTAKIVNRTVTDLDLSVS